jgi:hypothetical protein
MTREARIRKVTGLPWVHEWADMDRRRRWLWSVTLIWCALHILGFVGAMLFLAEYNITEAESWSDLVTYIRAADAIHDRAPLYELTPWDDVMTYHYHPLYALVFSVLAELPFRLLSVIWLALQATAYLAWLPLTLVFSEWYANLLYANIACTLLLLSGLLTLAILDEKWDMAGIMGVLILMLKPQWLFPLVVPVVFRRWKLLAQIVLVMLVTCAALNGLYVLIVGPDYGIDTLQDYATFLTRITDNYPWEGKSGSFGDMNHSWRQIFSSYFGFQSWIGLATVLVKTGMIALPGFLIVKAWRRQVTIQKYPQLVLWFVGLGYLLAMAMLGQLWELLGGVVIFLFIQGVPDKTIRQIALLFLIYALYEFQAVISVVPGLEWLFLPQSLPLTMLALLLLYGILLLLVFRSLVSGEEKGTML